MKMKSFKLSHLLLITIVIAALCMHLSTFLQTPYDEALQVEGTISAQHGGMLSSQ